jgi:hypothetical protein
MYNNNRNFTIRPRQDFTPASGHNNNEKFSKFWNVAQSAIYNAAGVQNPEDVAEVTSKVLGLANNIRNEYQRIRELDMARKNEIRAMQMRPLVPSSSSSASSGSSLSSSIGSSMVTSNTQAAPIQISPACQEMPLSMKNNNTSLPKSLLASPALTAFANIMNPAAATASPAASAFANSSSASSLANTEASPIPPIYLPMKPEEVKNMTQDQAQALLGNLLSQLLQQQKK